ncbi:SKIP/SNW domain-domain-containing protein [Catenaria anguillulae PL171]|uniref:Pre-mRNA-processing protein 45 n=1 Tax=Catenaria anguillulae PL171 TaxID=765915 RepID=A0A1Y2H5T4_9FUNG|nr:SKIP/SNW domain-domain-containing protein [Catenaria anguillulae PL171]
MSLLSFLPAPKSAPAADPPAPAPSAPAPQSQALARQSGPPPYGHRQGFQPRRPADFGDGGAFPEIDMIQYPLDMGRDKSAATSTTVALQVDEHGRLRYDALARQGHSSDAVVLAEYKDLVPMDIPADAHERWTKPSEEEVAATTEKTRKALELIVSGKVASIKPSEVVKAGRPGAPTIIKYTPTQLGGKEGKTRVISLVEQAVDPLEPPKFGFKRLPAGPPSPPPPVMHSPPRKLTKKERDEWTIPPCISNWKNAKGYTIPLDKRLAADGRGLQETVINDRFAQFSEALQIAERHAREEVRQRAVMQAKIAEKERQLKEDGLRQLAQAAREERAGFGGSAATRGEAAASMSGRRYDDDDDQGSGSEGESEAQRSDEDDESFREREALRRDKQRQLQREYRMSHMGTEAKARHAKSMEDRDMSEKIALGVAKPSVSKEALFDSRLFNQSEGLGSGFGSEDAYDVYDSALFSGAQHGISSVYRPGTRGDSETYGGSGDADAAFESLSSRTDKFMPEPGRGFSGADRGSAGPRDGPVEFERASDNHYGGSGPSAGSTDVFGVNDFMSQAKGRGREREEEDDGRGADASKRRRHD